MRRSTDRILTTHVGSLVKPDDLLDMITAKQRGEPYDEPALRRRTSEAIRDVVKQQAETGLDIVNDGEFSKTSWGAYFSGRLTGVEARPGQVSAPPHGIVGRDERVFPEWFVAARAGGGPTSSSYVLRAALASRGRPVAGIQGAFCTGPIKYIGQEEVQRDIANLKAAVEGLDVEPCMTALAPATMTYFLKNEHYANDRDFVFAVAEAMNEEYRAIAEAGILLQLDEPGIASCWQSFPDMSVDEFRAWVDMNIEAINVALQGVPEDRVRMHTCWGSIHHPHSTDIPLERLLDLILKANVGAYSLEAANPRHDHDWHVWENVKLPDGKLLIPGVIGHYTDFIEHPRLIADRLIRYANVVGKENVIAGVDCGLGTRVGTESIVWAKFNAMVEGAQIASQELWS